MMFVIAALALASFETVPAQAQPIPAEPERKICRTEPAPTGSRMSRGKRVCRTAAEWAAESNRTRTDLESIKPGVER